MYDMTITKREVFVSIVIVCVMILFGVIIADGINDTVMERQQEFNTAVKIDNDKDLFEYGMKTNVGNAFVYGELKAVDTVTFDEIGGEYSYLYHCSDFNSGYSLDSEHDSAAQTRSGIQSTAWAAVRYH